MNKSINKNYFLDICAGFCNNNAQHGLAYSKHQTREKNAIR